MKKRKLIVVSFRAASECGIRHSKKQKSAVGEGEGGGKKKKNMNRGKKPPVHPSRKV